MEPMSRTPLFVSSQKVISIRLLELPSASGWLRLHVLYQVMHMSSISSSSGRRMRSCCEPIIVWRFLIHIGLGIAKGVTLDPVPVVLVVGTGGMTGSGGEGIQQE